ALPETWSETENVAWKTNIPGLGWSSPIVWDDHVFVTAAISAGEEAAPIKGLYDPGDDQGSLRDSTVHRWMVYDLDFNTGRIRWQRELHSSAPSTSRHIKNSFASETPVTDGERVYVYAGSVGLVAALDLTGKIVWSKDIGVFDGRSRYGSASSPVVFKDR